MRKISGTDIWATPHIASTIAIWKKFHGSLQTMMGGNSSIGFNSSTSVIDCHDDAWANIVKISSLFVYGQFMFVVIFTSS
ncbi:hypothetical protein ACS0TY_007055 [Phlomoides rotata]